MTEHVILVDEQDNEVGLMEKLEAHQKGLLHRAFSVLLFNSKGELLLQKRAMCKYHSGGLWSNTCCSHPMPGENIQHATTRKLKQEMGINLIPQFAYKFVYKAYLDHNLTEYELDHVFTATFEGIPQANPDEVEDWRFVDITTLKKEMADKPSAFTAWFHLIMNHPQFELLAASKVGKSGNVWVVG